MVEITAKLLNDYVCGKPVTSDVAQEIQHQAAKAKGLVHDWFEAFTPKCNAPLSIDWMTLALESKDESDAQEPSLVSEDEVLSEMDSIIQQAESLVRLELRDKAQQVLKSLIERVNRLPDHPPAPKAKTLSRVALALHNFGDQEETNAIYGRVVKLAQESSMSPQPFLRHAFNHTGLRAMQRFDYADAVPLIHFAIQSTTGEIAAAIEHRIQQGVSLGYCHFKLNESRTAVKILDSALDEFQKLTYPQRNTLTCVADGLEYLAKSQFATGHYEQAMTCQQELLEYTDKVVDVGPSRTQILERLGMYSILAENLDLGQRVFQRLIEHEREKFADAAKPLLGAYNALAVIAFLQKDLDTAEKHIEEAEAALDEASVIYDDLIAATLNNRGRLYWNRGLYPAAIAEYDRALQIPSDHLGEYCTREVLVSNMAVVVSDAGNFDRALSLFEESKQLILMRLGKDSAAYAVVLNNLAITEFELGNTTKAVSLLEQAIEIFEQTAGAQHSFYKVSNSNLQELTQPQSIKIVPSLLMRAG